MQVCMFVFASVYVCVCKCVCWCVQVCLTNILFTTVVALYEVDDILSVAVGIVLCNVSSARDFASDLR